MSDSFSFPDFDPNKTDEDVRTIEEIYGYNKKKENVFLDAFKERLQKDLEDGFLGESRAASKNYDIYGDRRRVSSTGNTVADLGGGNTAITQDNSALINSQLAMLNQPNPNRMAGQSLGGTLGAAAGAGVLAKAGGLAGAGMGTILGTAALGPIGAIAGGLLGGLL